MYCIYISYFLYSDSEYLSFPLYICSIVLKDSNKDYYLPEMGYLILF